MVLLLSLLLLVLVLLAGGAGGLVLALRNPEQTASRVARPIAAFSRFGAPAIWLLGRSTDLILRLFGRHGPPAHTVTEEELKMLITEGAATGVIEHQERDIINRVLRLADKPVRAIMTPRNDLAWIDRTDPKADIVAALRTRAAAPAEAEDVAEAPEDVLEVGEDRRVEALSASGRGTAYARVSEPVVARAFVLVAQNVVGTANFLKGLHGLWVVGMGIRMVLFREVAERLFDIGVRSLLRNAKD